MVFYSSCAVLMAVCIIVKVSCECPDSCNKCDENNECLACDKGFYVENGRCKSCSSLCLDCTTFDDCTECIPGSWGSVCNETCLYANNNLYKCKDERCDIETGQCAECDGESCKPCRPNCSSCISFDECEKCLDGWYGPTCERECDRMSCSACEISSNRCTKCKPGYTLRNNTCCPQNCPNCDRDARCLKCYDGFYGDTCQDSCMENCKTCSSRDNCTECGLHFYDSKSQLEAGLCMCDVRECKNNANEKFCRQCKQPGWYTHKRGCCPCPKFCKDQSDCKPYTGHCRNGCKRGWFGAHCDKRCNINCVTCKNYDICQQCENEYYGHACQYNCSLGCVQSSEGPLCNVETGHCVHGCENGTWGKTCNRTCGKNCVNGYCNSNTGHCLGCKSTHFGLFCEKEAASKVISNNPMVPIIIVCIATCVVVSIIVVALVNVFRKRGNNNSDIKNKSIELNAVGTTPAGAKRRHRQNSDDEVIIENAMYEPFHQSLYQGNEINAQNALLAKPGNTGGETTNDFQYSAPNDPRKSRRGRPLPYAVYSLPIKDNRHP